MHNIKNKPCIVANITDYPKEVYKDLNDITEPEKYNTDILSKKVQQSSLKTTLLAHNQQEKERNYEQVIKLNNTFNSNIMSSLLPNEENTLQNMLQNQSQTQSQIPQPTRLHFGNLNKIEKKKRKPKDINELLITFNNQEKTKDKSKDKYKK